MASIPVLNQKGEKVGNFKLNEKLFDGSVNKHLLQQAVTMYLANRRTGSAHTKTRRNVRGGGKKPWRQKGTGRARVGSIRSPLWRAGGVVFGPHPKNWHYQLPKKIKRLALLSSFNAKLNEDAVTVIEEIGLESHKTKELSSLLKKMKLANKRSLIIAEKVDENLRRSTRNLGKVVLFPAKDVNAYQVLANDKVVVEKKALQILEKELAGVA